MGENKIEITTEEYFVMSEREKLYNVSMIHFGRDVFIGHGVYQWSLIDWIQMHDRKFLNKYRGYFNLFVNGFGE